MSGLDGIKSINHWARDYKQQTLARATNGLPPLEAPGAAAMLAAAKKKKKKTRKPATRYRSELP